MPAAEVVIQTDDIGADDLTTIGAPPTIQTGPADPLETVTLADGTVGARQDTTLDLTLPFALDADDVIQMNFPDQIDVSNVDAAVTGTFENGNEITCAPLGQAVYCTVISGPTATSGTIIMTGITSLYESSDDMSNNLLVLDEGVPGDIIALGAIPALTDSFAPPSLLPVLL